MNRTIDITTVRQRFGTIVDEVFYRNDVITIERKGNPLAQLVPLSGKNQTNEVSASSTSGTEQLLAELHSLPVISIHEDPCKLLRNTRDRRADEASRRCEN